MNTSPRDPPGPGDKQPTWVEIADAVWLAALTRGRGTEAPEPSAAEETPLPEPSTDNATTGADPPPPLPPVNVRTPRGPTLRRQIAPVVETATSVEQFNRYALLGAGGIVRALRPFKRLVASATETEPDEVAIAERAAETGHWIPRYRPVETHSLRVVLVVDAGPSMAVWDPTVTAFRLLMERQGPFRGVRTYTLSAQRVDGRLTPRIRGSGGGLRNSAEMLDTSGRQVFFVLSDGLNPLWREPRMDRLLRRWGRSGPVAIVNPFPQGHWHRTNLTPRRARLHSPQAVTPNAHWTVTYPEEHHNPFDTTVDERAMAVPVLELGPRWIRWWARLVMEPSAWVDAIVHAVDPSTPPDTAPATEPRSASDLVLRFRSGTSATAFRLATYIAAAPLDLPLLRRMQRSLLPDSAPHHLAAIVTSELVRPAGDDPTSLEFVDGVREALLACATRDDSAKAVRVVAAHQRHRVPTTFTDAIEAPDLTPETLVTDENLAMARIELAVLSALSGPYARRARRLQHAIDAWERNTSGEPPEADEALTPAEPAEQESPGGRGTGQGESGEEMTEFSASEPSREPGIAEDRDRLIGSDDDPILSIQTLLEGHGHESGPAVWGKVPTRNPVFTGRRELLDQLERRLQTESVAAVLPQALHGEGGVGKSQIAIEYAYRHRGDYDVIWWVPSERPAQILASIIELGNKLGLEVGNEVITAVPRVRNALRAGTPYANWLLVFDNAETLETVREYFPEAGTGRVLVTSRNQEWSRIAETLEVDVFTRQESIRLLKRRNQGLADIDADQLAEALGDLPLAIEHASAWLAATGMGVPEYLSVLREKRAELTALVPTPGYEMPVAAAANVALDRLAVENPAALQLLQVCSFFAPEPISRELFTGPRMTPIATELDEALQNPSLLNQAMLEIEKYVLARIDHRANTLQLHRLVQAVLQGRMPEDQRFTMEHGAHLLLASGGRPGDPSDQANWLSYQALASHLTASNAIACEDGWARDLVLNLVKFYFYWGDYDSGTNLAQQVVDEWRQRLGENHRQTLSAAKWLGYFWWVNGNFAAAAEIQRDTLVRYERSFGRDDLGTIDAMSMVASTRRVYGQFTAARDIDLDAFQRARRLFGGDNPETLRAAHNLGVSLRLTGEFRTARNLDGDTYRRRVAVLGEDHPETLRTLNNLSIDERECGEYIKSRQLVERIYQRYVNLFGVEHPDTIRVARNLAVARRRAGDHEKAYKLAEDTMNRLQDRFDVAQPDAIAAALNFAVDIRESDDLPRAHAVAAQTAERYHATLGPDHPYTLYARTNLGIVLRLLDRHDEALRHNREAHEKLEQSLGRMHILTLTCAINLASDLAAAGRYEEAYNLDRDTWGLARRIIGEEHPSTLACALNLALDLDKLGRTDEASELFRETVETYERVLGEAHPAITAAHAGMRANCDVDPMPF
ncbi:cytochrome c [Virgisporangium aliadipatigenens]|uniref:Cytochrome c n=1 Tax=Virgisporangium aliadipatigenens TaxID=741659 RepID=A0A8J3YQ94_9ACTN|nr:FxSxx-COOH system tetratricopeptide repeat protein [Virgisporangium aliadipatigenens]GIJ48487.1 cytochrome c [Virgisporangium aliadipatigenens]